MSKPIDFLEEFQTDHPDLAEDISDLASLYQKKLWHQLTLKLEECYSKPAFNQGTLPVDLYQNFISDFGHKINLLKLSQFAVHVSKYVANTEGSIGFLASVAAKLAETKDAKAEQPILFLKAHIAQHKLETGHLADCKEMIEKMREDYDTMSEVDPSVSAALYYVGSLYYKACGNFAEFYKNSLMYMSYVSSETLPVEFKLRLAIDVSLAALLGEHIYNFGQLLQHPIVSVLSSSPFYWLFELLQTFNDGDMHKYEELCKKYATQLNAQPALVENERRLREKITIMCLLELISSLPAEDRRIPLSLIAEKTKLSIDGVEFLLMKALSLHLIKGTIDQVEGYVQVSWVQPRILTKPQINGLKVRLDEWISKVNAITVTLEHESVGVVEV